MYNNTVLAVLETVIHGKYVNQCLSQLFLSHLNSQSVTALVTLPNLSWISAQFGQEYVGLDNSA